MSPFESGQLGGRLSSVAGKVLVEPSSYVGTGENTPTASVRAFDQGEGTRKARRPSIAGRDRRNSVQKARTRDRAHAGDNAPTVPIPVFDQRVPSFYEHVPLVTHGPDVTRAGSGYPTQDGGALGVGAGYDAPTGAIPVLDQCGKPTAAAAVSHCPDVVRAKSDHAVEFVVRSWHIRTGNHTPTRAIPVHDECLDVAVDVRKAAHGPDIVRRVGVHAVQRIESLRAGAWTGDDLPTRSVPVQNERDLVEGVAARSTAHGPCVRWGNGGNAAFAEAASDDGSLTGRGKPLLRGVVCGLMTTAGGIGHTLPYLIPNFRTATAIAVVIVAVELLLISWIRKRFMDTPFLRAAFQVIVGGVLVFLVGIWIGSS